MDRQAFKQRMQNLKSYRENNPGKGYWDWKVEAFAEGGKNDEQYDVTDTLKGYYSNHTGTPTMYVPVTKEYEATPEGFGEILNVHTPEVTITPKDNISLEAAVDKGRRTGAKIAAPIVIGAGAAAMSTVGGLGTAMDISGIITDPLDPLNYLGQFGKVKNVLKQINPNIIKQISNTSSTLSFPQTTTEQAVSNIRQGIVDLKDYYKSSEYRTKLVDAGYTKLEQEKIIQQLLSNLDTNTSPFKGVQPLSVKAIPNSGVEGMSKIEYQFGDPNPFKREINVWGRDNYTTAAHEAAHASTLNIEPGSDMLNPIFLEDAMSKYQPDLYKVLQQDLKMFPERDGADYFKRLQEVRSRSLSTSIIAKKNGMSLDQLWNQPEQNWTSDMVDLVKKFGKERAKELTKQMLTIGAIGYGASEIDSYAEGGEIGDDEKERFYQITGRSSSGRPLEEGLKPVFGLEDAANMTPIGDAISVKDTYDAVKNRDWLGAGLAALTVLPFVPSGLRNVKAAARYIPTVNRTEQNRNRAEQADKIFGTNYSETYDLLDDLYQHRYFDLPEVQPKDMVASGRLQAKPFAEERFNKTGVGAEPNEFDLWVNTGMYRDPMQLANHEMNHYTDYIISRNIDTSVNNNMLKQLENSLKQTDATDYYRKGTEQKAYMNQLRTILKQNGEIQNLDEPVSSALLKKYLDKMPDSDPIKKMSKQHKNIKTYTKWFNTIPLLGTAALGVNTYFNNKENKQ